MNKIKKVFVLLALLVVLFGLGSCDLLWFAANQKGLTQSLEATKLVCNYLMKELKENRTNGVNWECKSVEKRKVITLNGFDLKTTGADNFKYYENSDLVNLDLKNGDYVLSGKIEFNSADENKSQFVFRCEILKGNKVEGEIKYNLKMSAKVNGGVLDENTLTFTEFIYNGEDKTSALNNILSWMKED